MSCREQSADNRLVEGIGRECKNQFPCVIDFTRIVSEDWDYMYIFKENASLEEVNTELGISYPFFEDIARRIIFLRNKSIVYHQDDFPNAEGLKDQELVFDLSDSVKFVQYSNKNAKFVVKKITFENGSYFDLKHVE